MKAIYAFLKLLVQISTRIFYRNLKIINPKGLKFRHGAIVISNHPNTLFDPLNVAGNMYRQVHFLANASMFASPMGNWFWSNLFCIPIQRAKDSGAKHVKNEDSFARCDAFLANDGVLWIAPEGGSEMERSIRPFKTGTARIGFSAENKADFKINLPIIPVGLSYSNPEKFRSKVIINTGEAIYPKDYVKDYQADNRAAVKLLTGVLEEKLKALSLDIQHKDAIEFYEQVEELIQNQDSIHWEEAFNSTKQAFDKLNDLGTKQPTVFNDLKRQVGAYFKLLNANQIKDKSLLNKGVNPFLEFLFVLIGAPIFVFGLINNAVGLLLPKALTKTLKLYPGYNSTVKILSAILIFPIWYFLLYQLIGNVLPGNWSVLYMVLVPLAGYLALLYAESIRGIFRKWRARIFKMRQRQKYEALIVQRTDIWQKLSKVLTLRSKN